MKKAICILTAILLGIFLFSACASGADSAATTDQTVQSGPGGNGGPGAPPDGNGGGPGGSSTWTLTADSYVTEFNGSAANVVSNGYTLYVNGTALTGTN